MKRRAMGYYIESGGPGGLDLRIPYYGIRYNSNKAALSNKALGLQVLIDFLGNMMWINIEAAWLVQEEESMPNDFQIMQSPVYYVHFQNPAIYNKVIRQLVGKAAGGGNLFLSAGSLIEQIAAIKEEIRENPDDSGDCEFALEKLGPILDQLVAANYSGDVCLHTR